MTQPVTIWITPVSNLAGVARHFLDAARVGIPGWQMQFVCPPGPLYDRLEAAGNTVHQLNLEQPLPQAVGDLRRILCEVKPDIAHSHLAKADFLLTMASAGLGCTLISTEHHIPEDPLTFHGSKSKAYTRQLAHHARSRRFAHLIAVSESTKRDIQKYWRTPTPVTVVLNGVDHLEAATERTPGLRFLSLTRLSHEKNLDMTLRAFARILHLRPEATLTIAGEGDEAPHLQALAHELHVERATTFPGFVNADEAMRSHDVLLQPSKADNLSYTLLDAVNAGMGVVATAIGGNPEILSARALVQLGDVEGLATAAIAQAEDLSSRPHLPSTIPTVSEMTAQIASVYAASGFGDRELYEHLTTSAVALTPEVSVITAYFRNASTFAEQLDALAGQKNAPTFEVIVADNEGSAELPLIVAQYRETLNIRILPAFERQGQCWARNQGLAAARGDIALFADADDIVCDVWVQKLAERLREENAIATGSLRLDRINPEHSWREYRGLKPDDPVSLPVLQEPFGFLGYLPFGIGCNLGFRTQTLRALGGFDPEILGGSEDVDLSWRAQEAGISLAYVPAAVVDYRLRTTPRAIFRQRMAYQRSQLHLWRLSQLQGRPVNGMSLRWAVTESARLPSRWVSLRHASFEERFMFSAQAGAILGNLIGQLQERTELRKARIKS